MEGNEVKELQELLRELDYDVPLGGIFDHETYKAVRSFQASHLDKHDQPLVVDGKVGPLTMWALQQPRRTITSEETLYTDMPAPSFGGSFLGRRALQTAIDELMARSEEHTFELQSLMRI